MTKASVDACLVIVYRLEPVGWVVNQKGAWLSLEDEVDLKLTGKVALVTGSTAGIGFAIAQSLASEGAHVYVNGRTRKRVDAAIATTRSRAAAVSVDGIAADFSGSAGAEAVIAKLCAVDVLVNNVGIFEPKPFFEDRLAQAGRVIRYCSPCDGITRDTDLNRWQGRFINGRV